MRIGLDFDNTIVDYDHVFFSTARAQDLIPETTSPTKRAVRDYLRAQNNEDAWTKLQGFVYGTRMEHADLFSGIPDFLKQCRRANAEVFIISHKTPHPYLGPAYDLYAAARTFIQTKGLHELGIPAEQVFFEVTKEKKIQRITDLQCDAFLDDLPEFLSMPQFPPIKRYLFDPQNQHQVPDGIIRVDSWTSFAQALFTKNGDEPRLEASQEMGG